MRLIIAASALMLATACTKETPPAPPPTPEASASETAPAAPFVVNALGETEEQIQGCMTMLSRTGADPAAGEIYYAAAADEPPAEAYIRIDAALMKLALVASEHDEATGKGSRTFQDADKAVTIVEALTAGDAHQESDSVDQAGTLTITYNGQTQVIDVEGGTAC